MAGFGCGFALARSSEVLTHYAGLSLGDDGAPVWRGGARWVLASSARLALEGTRREPANDDAAPDQRIGFTLSVRW